MIIGVPKEVKMHEYRVGLSPEHAFSYVKNGHTVYVQKGAGLGSGFEDKDYLNVGCMLLDTIEEIYSISEMIIKVKEPLSEEYNLLREGQIVYTFFHLAASQELTQVCLDKKIIAIAYETIVDKDNRLPCLKPMSEVAGRLSVLEGSKYLEKPFGGRGVLLSGAVGVSPANVLVLGAGGIAGKNAVSMAVGLHANVVAMDISLNALSELDQLYAGRISTIYSTDKAIKEQIKTADLVIIAALVPGAKAPKLIKKEYLKDMKQGSVIVDIAIDQGGGTETSKLTYHSDPIYTVDGVVHYCVGNMPGSVPFTSTLALNNATLSYGLKIANNGVIEALKDKSILMGLNTYLGHLTCKPVADVFNIKYVQFAEIMK